MNKMKENKYPIVIAFLQWFFTTIFQIDRLFFIYDKDTNLYRTVKILYFLFLLLFWCFLFHVRKKVKERNKEYQRGVFVFCIYMSIMMFILVVLWPGTWSHDDLGVIVDNLHWYNWAPWQHIITSVYQMILLQILPFPGGIILLQNIIISCCIAFIIVKIEKSFRLVRLHNIVLDTVVKILPFLLPPVLMYQFSGYRMGLYIYLELVTVVILICSIKDKLEWSVSYLILFCILCIITSTWRTESFFYIPISCLLMLIIKKSILSNAKKIVGISLLVFGFFGMNEIQNNALGNSNYEMMSILRPCVEVIRVADKEIDAELLSEISKVVNLDIVYDNPEVNGETLYWGYGVVEKEYSREDYRACLKAFIKLCVKYPKVVIKERLTVLIWASGVDGTTANNVRLAATLFDEKEETSKAGIFQNAGWVANKAVFPILRKQLIYTLGCRNNTKIYGGIYRIVWNALIPIIILFYAWIKALLKKEWYWLLIVTAVLIKVPIIILTQPAGWFMYFLSNYFLGYVFLIYKFLIWRTERSVN